MIRPPLLPLLVVSLLGFSILGCGGGETKAPPEPEIPAAAGVHVAFEFDGEAVAKSLDLDFTAGDSLLVLMQRAERDGKLELAISGEGDLAFVTAIDGVENEGADGQGRNWQYWVNDEYAQVGAGTFQPEPGDDVEWKFTTDAMKADE